jgi:F0F1-type ATP synthase alpha subunit
MPAEEQVSILFAGVNGHLDGVVTSELAKFEKIYLETLKSKHPHILETIRKEKFINEQIESELKAFLETFIPNSGLKMKP